MEFSKEPRERDPTHASAVRRLNQARDEQQRLTQRRDAAVGTAAESESTRSVDAGRAQVAAREAWLTWVERTVFW